MKMINGQYITGGYKLDVGMIIDLTGSMSPFLNTVKAQAQQLVDLIFERMEDAGKSIDQLRLRIIGFRDYKYDGDKAMVESPVFMLPQDKEAFQEFLNGLEATGGGDAPENGLEALAMTMRWFQEVYDPSINRNIIFNYTDTNTHALHDPECVKNPLYPADMPKDMSELIACMHGTSQTPYTMPNPRIGRMILFTPEVEPWTTLASQPNTWHEATKLNEGVREANINSIADLFVNSTVA